MKRLVTVLFLCLAASGFMGSSGLGQEATPTEDASVPEGAVANDSRVFMKGGLDDVETVEFIIMTNWEMDSPVAAERFFEDIRASVPTDLTLRESTEQLQNLNDDQVLIVGDDQFGGPVTVVLFREGNFFGTWMAIGDVGQDKILAEAYNAFFTNRFSASDPFPAVTHLPAGYAAIGMDDRLTSPASAALVRISKFEG